MNRFSDILGPDGLITRVLSNYEYRPSQLEMAGVVAAAMEEQKSALIEAGTGIGKTLAYLVPLVSLGLRCVISTGTKNLQGQIFRKDIPLLEKCFGKRIKAYILKGRANYLCLRRWRQFSSSPGLNFSGVAEGILTIREWQTQTKTGDCNELEWLSENDPLWSEICSTSDTCSGLKCKDYERCFVTTARQEAAGADLVIVNHHLLMADCCLRIRSKTSAIPSYSRLVLDEAHMLENIATEYFGLGVSNYRIQELTRNIRKEASEANLEDAELSKVLERLLERSSAFFGSILIREERFSVSDKIISSDTKKRLMDLISILIQLSSILEKVGTGCDPILLCYRKTQEIQNTLDFICDHNDPDFVFWGERRKNSVSLRISPIDVSDQLVTHLFKPLKGLVLTSATLSTDQGFDYIKTRLGLSADYELILESHFDYGKQAVIFNPREMPIPYQNEFLEQLGPQISRILKLTKGRALLLFTSYRNLEKVYNYLKGEGLEYKLLKQGEGPKEHLLDEFWNDINSVLLATSSFWQGVDIPGEALSCVVIDRLPFSVPTDPVTEARINWIRNRGGNPFQEYQLPAAIITLKQGLGRLIRHRQDRGLLVILDSRTYTKSYGKTVLKNLPKCPVVRTLDETAKLIKQLKII
ncbi:MAG: ATP-dependent DNA helicase [bacterium]